MNTGNVTDTQLFEQLDVVSQRLCGQGSKCLDIMQNEYFDVLFSLLYYFEDLSTPVKKQTMNVIMLALRCFKNYIVLRKLDKAAEENMLTLEMARDQESITE